MLITIDNDIVTIYRLIDVPGEDAIIGVLTNENVSIYVQADGTIAGLSPAGLTLGTFKVYEGIILVDASEIIFSTAGDAVGCSVSIDDAGIYKLNLLNLTVGTVTLQAYYKNMLIEKVLTINKISSNFRLTVSGGYRTIVFDKDDNVFVPPEFGTFTAMLKKDSVDITSLTTFRWDVPPENTMIITDANGNTNNTFTPTLVPSFVSSAIENWIQVTATYEGENFISFIPITIVKGIPEQM